MNQPVETLLGKRILDFTPKSIEAQVNEMVSDILVNGRLANIHMPFLTGEGTELFLQISANLIFIDGGKPDHVQIVLRDITERKLVEERIQRLALQDHLTKVDNRLSFTYRLNSLIAKMNRDGGHFALVYFDLDNFKAVNDRYGHYIGDKVLVAFTQRLHSSIRRNDFLARMGGDEFVLILENYLSEDELEIALHRIMDGLSDPFKIGEHLIHLQTSYGVSCYPVDGNNPEKLLQHADSAMYSYKRSCSVARWGLGEKALAQTSYQM
jgi:diguanylate cyclase (GGDEF)-like protein